MPFDNRLLVILRTGDELQPALDRAQLIASRLGTQVHLIPDKAPGTNKQQKDWVQNQADKLSRDGLDVRVKEWGKGDLIENVLAAAQADDYGLVIKASDRSHPLADVLHTPRDWKLLRYSFPPVLMVNQQESWVSRPLVAAIDADPNDAEHSLLNKKILQMSDRIASINHSPLHLVTAYPAPMQSATRELQSEDKISRRYKSYCREICDSLAIMPAHQEVAEGPPEIMIPAYCKWKNVGLVVMGTVARSGLRGALLGGNTAEVILAQLNADVLALKPEGYEEILQKLFECSSTEFRDP